MFRTSAEDRKENGRVRLVAIRDIPLVITLDPITSEDAWHAPKKIGDEFDFPEHNAKVLVKRGLADVKKS